MNPANGIDFLPGNGLGQIRVSCFYPTACTAAGTELPVLREFHQFKTGDCLEDLPWGFEYPIPSKEMHEMAAAMAGVMVQYPYRLA